jgi:hypothetical protein
MADIFTFYIWSPCVSWCSLRAVPHRAGRVTLYWRQVQFGHTELLDTTVEPHCSKLPLFIVRIIVMEPTRTDFMHGWYESCTHRHATVPRFLNLQQRKELISKRHFVNQLKKMLAPSNVRAITSRSTSMWLMQKKPHSIRRVLTFKTSVSLTPACFPSFLNINKHLEMGVSASTLWKVCVQTRTGSK